ncbi:unnamed protein product [Penicillium pancosmium]
MASISDIKLLASLANIPINEPIPTSKLTIALSQPPFIALPGSMNIRDLGTFAPGYVKPLSVFRSGRLDSIPESSRSLLRSQLQLSHIFDFRYPEEATSALCEIDGINLVSCPADVRLEHSPASFTDLVEEHNRVRTFLNRTSFKRIFEALKVAKEGQAVLFHCTGGKDRTGVMAALILDLMGAPAQVIADEYALTRIGIEPFREELLHEAVRHFAAKLGQPELNVDTPGVCEMLGSSSASMIAFVKHLREDLDGAEGYLRKSLGFSEHDVEAIRQNLRPSS